MVYFAFSMHAGHSIKYCISSLRGFVLYVVLITCFVAFFAPFLRCHCHCHGARRQRRCYLASQVKRFTQVTGMFKALLAKQPQWPALPWHVTDDAAVIPPGLASLPADEAR